MPRSLDPLMPLAGPVDNTLHCAEIAYDVEYEQFTFHNDVESVLASTEATTNLVNLQFEHQVHITHLITAVVIRTATPDIYTDAANMLEMMQAFGVDWLTNQAEIPRDVVMLTFWRPDGPFATGVANIASVCDPNRHYCAVQGLGIPNIARDVTSKKHELGHTWGAFHCSCPGHTMNVGSHDELGFSPETIDVIVAYRDSVACLDICGTVETGSTSIPFLEDFEGPVIDPTRWIGIDGPATVSDLGVNEPSGSQSLRISGNAEICSGFMNTVGPWGWEVSYHWQAGGLGTSPGPGDSLMVEFLDRNFGWVPIGEHTGDGSSGTIYELVSTVLQLVGHDMFRIRIRSTTSGKNGGGGTGLWMTWR